MQIDFYILKQNQTMAHWYLACRLLEKMYNENHSCYVYMNSRDDLEQLNTLLWTFKDKSFIPHVTIDNMVIDNKTEQTVQNENLQIPIILGMALPPKQHNDCLLNFALEVPSFYNEFQRVFEIVPALPEFKGPCRDKFRFYRDQGIELKIHELN